jgi:hypothetical protein
MRCDDEIARRGVEADDSWALTVSGEKIVFLRPNPKSIHIEDIAQHLSLLCRFSGATTRDGEPFLYSVAQHSVLVGQLVKTELDNEGVDWTVEYWDQILAALLHDAPEFILNDLSSPLKACMRGRYKEIDGIVQRAIFESFDINLGYMNQTIKNADNIAILIERYYFMPDHPGWPKISKAEMVYERPPELTHKEAQDLFLSVVKSALAMRDALKAEQLLGP